MISGYWGIDRLYIGGQRSMAMNGYKRVEGGEYECDREREFESVRNRREKNAKINTRFGVIRIGKKVHGQG